MEVLLLLLSIGFLAFIFVPGKFWEWVVEQMALKENKSVDEVTSELMKDLHAAISGCVEGEGAFDDRQA